MEQQTSSGFNLSEFVVASQKNPRKEPVVKETTEKSKPEFNVKVDFKKLKISFDRHIAAEMNLENNSLAHAVHPQTGEVAIIVVPGNEGVFAKKIANRRSKGTSFKNLVLMRDLVKSNLTSGKYNLQKIGAAPAEVLGKTIENCDYYLLVQVGEPQLIDLTKAEQEEAAKPVLNIVTESAEQEPVTSDENQKF